jgi:hypothetical protein
MQKLPYVTVTKKSGESERKPVERVSKPFDVDGVPHVYCFFEEGGSSRRKGRRTGCSCGSREDEDGVLIDSPNNCRSCEFDAYDM